MPLDTAGSTVAAKRQEACKALLCQAHAILAKEGVTPSALHAMKLELVALANQCELFPLSDFAMPEAEARSHILQVEDNDGLGLYLTISMPGKEAGPHDHGIWCVNAAISGRERHVMCRRTDDGSKPGRATLTKVGEVMVEPGNGYAMADHDIHSTLVIGDEPAVGLALYGYALTRFPSVVWYNTEFSSVRAMPSRRREAVVEEACVSPQSFQIKIANTNKTITCAADQTVLQASVAAGIDYPFGCASGNCGACISHLDAGEVCLLPRNDGALSAAQAAAGQTLACRAQPRSDVAITWLGRGRR